MDEIIIYADGGCRGNQNIENIGGWGALITYKENKKELYGSELNTTNNKMELMSAIQALKSLKKQNIPVKIYMDSAYVINGMNEWIYSWIKKGWKTANKKSVENQELWKELNNLRNTFDKIEFLKVKGHSDNYGNNIADMLANKGMDEIS